MALKANAELISVIILNYNGEDYIKECLSSVFCTKYPNFEVILIDNGSTDSSVKIIEENFQNDDRLKIIKSDKNLGFSGGNNLGFSHAKGYYVAFLNNDTIPDPYWLDSLVGALENDKTIGLAGSTILSIDGKKLRGAGGLWSDELLFLCAVGAGKSGDFRFTPIFEVSFASGCSMIARKEFINEIGLFDPLIPYNYDDTLLSIKTWLAGKRVVTVSGSRIRHIGGATTGKFWGSQAVAFSLMRAKICLIFDTYFNLSALYKALFILHFSILISSIIPFNKSNAAKFWGNTKASIWVIRNLRHVWISRETHWHNAKISPENMLAKFIRIRLNFPMSSLPSELTDLLYKSECRRFEEMIKLS